MTYLRDKPTRQPPIDAVITWVDGNNPNHRANRARYMAQSGAALGENATNPHRWESSDEITYCLSSIHRHAPWIGTIWIVVDHDPPDLGRLPDALCAKLRIVTHAELFAGYAHVLPTFNSLAIESMLWRIDGLAERFVYFNDDVFLTAPILPEDVFQGSAPVLRGKWVDYTGLLDDPAAGDDPALFNHFMHINGAALCGYNPQRLFACAHVAHPLRRSVMAQLFKDHRPAFEANIAHRFRDLGQFLPQGAHTHACLALGEFSLCAQQDYLHIKSGQGAGGDPATLRMLLGVEAMAGIKFLCVNDLPQLEALLPDARALIGGAIGCGLL
ncbi:MAG: Stealth CR1 domain-containing protein [Sulfitobacter sp.]